VKPRDPNAKVRPPPPPDAGYEIDVKSGDTTAPVVDAPVPPPRDRSPLMRKNVSEEASSVPLTTARRLPVARARCAAARVCRTARTKVRRATSAAASGSTAGAGAGAAAAWPFAAAGADAAAAAGAGTNCTMWGLSVTQPTYAAGATTRSRNVS
jgi:hypothetical protein